MLKRIIGPYLMLSEAFHGLIGTFLSGGLADGTDTQRDLSTLPSDVFHSTNTVLNLRIILSLLGQKW